MGHCGYFSVRQPNNGVPTTTSRTSEGIHYIIWNFAGFGFVSNCLQLPCIRSKNSSNHSLRWLNILMWLTGIASWQPEGIIFLRSYSSWPTCLSQRRPPLSQRPSPFHLSMSTSNHKLSTLLLALLSETLIRPNQISKSNIYLPSHFYHLFFLQPVDRERKLKSDIEPWYRTSWVDSRR